MWEISLKKCKELCNAPSGRARRRARILILCVQVAKSIDRSYRNERGGSNAGYDVDDPDNRKCDALRWCCHHLRAIEEQLRRSGATYNNDEKYCNVMVALADVVIRLGYYRLNIGEADGITYVEEAETLLVLSRRNEEQLGNEQTARWNGLTTKTVDCLFHLGKAYQHQDRNFRQAVATFGRAMDLYDDKRYKQRRVRWRARLQWHLESAKAALEQQEGVPQPQAAGAAAAAAAPVPAEAARAMSDSAASSSSSSSSAAAVAAAVVVVEEEEALRRPGAAAAAASATTPAAAAAASRTPVAKRARSVSGGGSLSPDPRAKRSRRIPSHESSSSSSSAAPRSTGRGLKARVEALEKDWVEEVDHDDALRSRIVRLELAIGMPLAVNVNFMQRVAAMEMESYGR